MHKSPISQATVANIFRVLRGRFGTAFVDKFRSGVRIEGGPFAGKDAGLLETMDVWANELAGLSMADIEHGLSIKFKFPPSCDEFVQACVQRDYSAQAHNTVPALPPAAITESAQGANLIGHSPLFWMMLRTTTLGSFSSM